MLLIGIQLIIIHPLDKLCISEIQSFDTQALSTTLHYNMAMVGQCSATICMLDFPKPFNFYMQYEILTCYCINLLH